MRRRVVAACAVAAVAAAGFAVPVWADPAVAEGGVAVEIVDVGAPVASEKEALAVAATVTNGGAREVRLSGAALFMQSAAPSTRSHLLDFLAGAETSVQELSSVARQVRLAPGASERIEFSVPASAMAWSGKNWGPRGIEVRASVRGADSLGASGAGGEAGVADRSLVVLGPSNPVQRVATGVVVPLTASVGELEQMPDAEALLGGQDVKVPPRVAALAGLGGPGVTLVADPAFGEVAAKSGAAQVLAGPAFDADVAALVHAGASDVARRVLAGSGAQAVVAASGVDSQTLEALGAVGESVVIVSSDDVATHGGDYATPSTHARLEGEGEADVLVADAAASSALAGSLPASGAHGAGEGAARLSALDSRQLTLALSAMTYLEQPATIRPQLLALDRASARRYGAADPGDAGTDSALAAQNLDAAIDALMAAPWVAPASVEDLRATDIASVTTSLKETAGVPGEVAAKAVRSLEAGRHAVQALTPLLSDPGRLTAPVDSALDRAWSVAWRADPPARASYLARTEDFLDSLSHAVCPVSSSTINVIAEETEIPARVQNALPFPVAVTVELDSVSARLAAGEPVGVELDPASTSTVNIPVTARGSGDVDARIRLRAADGSIVGSPAPIKVRVRAQWETWATFALGVAAALALVVGVVKSFRQKGRRSQPMSAREYSTTRRADARRRKGQSAYPELHFPPVSESGPRN